MMGWVQGDVLLPLRLFSFYTADLCAVMTSPAFHQLGAAVLTEETLDLPCLNRYSRANLSQEQRAPTWHSLSEIQVAPGLVGLCWGLA